MNTLTMALERASLIGVAALFAAYLAQKLLENRVPATWRVWIWRVALLQTTLALMPLSPMKVAVLPNSLAPVSVLSTGKENGTPETKPALLNSSVGIKSPAAKGMPSEGVLSSPVEDVSVNTEDSATPPESSQLEVVKLWCYWNQDMIWLALQGIYFLGLNLYLVRFAVSARRLRRALRSAVRIEDQGFVRGLRDIARRMNITSLPRLIQVKGSSPFLVGIVRPCIVLPDVTVLPHTECEAILSHELAHLKRRDLAWNLLAWGVQTVLWFHPLAWASRYFLPLETESACDEMVLASSRITPNFYGNLLLNTHSIERMPLAAGVTDGFSTLKTRIMRLNHAPRHPRRAGKILFASALGLALVVVLPIRLVSRLQADPNQMLAPRREESAKKKALIADIGIVQGTVVTPDGKPVKGARVSWVSYSANRTESILATTRSDAKGQFRFADSKTLLERSLDFIGPVQQVQSPQLLVEADGWGCFAMRISESNADSRTLHLTQPTELQATFLDPSGNPAPNVPVSLSFIFFEKPGTSNSKYIHFAHLKHFSAVTNANGELRFGGLPQGGRARLQVDDERFATLAYPASEVDLALQKQTIAKPISLEPGAILSGQISNSESGKPVAGIRVAAQGQDSAGGWGEAVSDSQGRYRMTMLRAGRYNLALDLDDKTSSQWTAAAHEGVSVTTGSQQENIDFKLEHGVLITGRVVTQGTGEPIEGAMIGIYGPAHPQSSAWVQGATSSSDGSYQLRVPAGEQYIYVSGVPEGFVRPESQPISTMDMGGKHSTPYQFTAEDGQDEIIDWQLKALPPAREVQVRVLDTNGQPAEGAQVEWNGVGEETRDAAFDQEIAKTDKLGRTTIKNVRGTIQVVARLGSKATPQAREVLGGQRVTLNLQTNALVELKGNIVDDMGNPLPGIKVDLFRWKQRSGQVSNSVVSDAQGHYSFPELWPDGTYSLSMKAPGYGQGKVERFQIKTGAAHMVKNIVLPKANSFIAGSVVDANEKPVSDATVWVSGNKTGPAETTTDENGNFRLDSIVPNDKLYLTVNQDRAFGVTNVQAGTSNAKIVIKKR